jgi:hypothetical protein
MATKRELGDGKLHIAPEHAWCRGLTGHRWALPSTLWAGPAGTIIIDLRCQNCKTTRRDFIDHGNGLVVRRNYNHAVGYLQKGYGRPRAGETRQAALDSLMRAKTVPVKPWKESKE